MPLIKSVMTPFPYSIGSDSPVEEAEAIMAKHDVRHLPVMEQDRLVGVITSSQIELCGNARSGNAGAPPRRVGDIYDMRAYVVDLSTRLDAVLRHMAYNHIGCALVVKNGRLAGIFTTTDACRHYSELLRTIHTPGDGNDAA